MSKVTYQITECIGPDCGCEIASIKGAIDFKSKQYACPMCSTSETPLVVKEIMLSESVGEALDYRTFKQRREQLDERTRIRLAEKVGDDEENE